MECVVLVHGIWMNGLEMGLLARRLRKAGYVVRRFRYPSVRGKWADNVAALGHFIAQCEAESVHVVAHSLGGLLVCHWIAGGGDPRIGRIVTVGSPLQGSALARGLDGLGCGRWLLGGARDALCGVPPAWTGRWLPGSLAGDIGVGVGMLMPGLARPNDGTVTVEETRLAQLADHGVIHASHFGLLFSHRAADEIIHFLRHGRFAHVSA